MPIILILALIVGGGTSLAAQSSLPGSVLYPVKVNINEGVQAFLSFGGEAGANVEADQALNRLEEAAEPSASGALTAEARAELKENFQLHAEQVKKHAAELEAKGEFEAATKVRSDFETSLRAREDILAQIEARIPDLRAEAGAAADVKTDAQGEVKSNSSSNSGTTSLKTDMKANAGVKVDLGL